MQGQGSAQIKAQCAQNFRLHFAYLIFCVGLVSDVDKVANFGSVHLFVFGGNEHGGHADQLKILSFEIIANVLKQIHEYTNVILRSKVWMYYVPEDNDQESQLSDRESPVTS